MAESDPSGFRNTRLVLVALLLGVVFVVLLNLQRMLEARRQRREQVQVVLVTANLENGEVLTESNVKPIAVSGDVAGEALGLYRYEDVLLGVTQVHARVAMNDLLRRSDMAPAKSVESGLARHMPGNHRAITFAVEARQPSAYVRPGARVDVFGAVIIDNKPAKIQLIIENIEVLSVDGETDPIKVRGNYRSVEVHVHESLVDPLKEVQRRLDGSITLSVRRPNDMMIVHPRIKDRPEEGATIPEPLASSLQRPFTGRSRSATQGLDGFDN